MRIDRLQLVLAALVLAALVGCGSGGYREDPLLALSSEEALVQGKALMEEGKYREAEEYLNHAFQVEPNSPGGREALLLAADALFLAGGEQNYIRAEGKYRDFQNRFPTAARGDYVLFQVARSLHERMLKPDRDQEAARKALSAYQEVVTLFPTSEYAEEARLGILEVRANLAESEFLVGRFYSRLGLPKAAIARFETLLDQYPEYPQADRALLLLGKAQVKMEKNDEALATFDRLRAEFPDSGYLEDIPRVEKEKPLAEPAEGDPAPETEVAEESPA